VTIYHAGGRIVTESLQAILHDHHPEGALVPHSVGIDVADPRALVSASTSRGRSVLVVGRLQLYFLWKARMEASVTGP